MKEKQTEVTPMKKLNFVLFTIAMSLAMLLALVACSTNDDTTYANGNANTDATQSTNQYSNEQSLPQEPLVDTDANQSTKQSANEQSLPQETLAGVVQSIDGMTFAIDTSQIFMAVGTPGETTEQRVGRTDEPGAAQTSTIRVTGETVIVVRTTAGGQIIGERAGTIDDLSLHNIVMVEGEWQSDEFLSLHNIVMVEGEWQSDEFIASELITIGF